MREKITANFAIIAQNGGDELLSKGTSTSDITTVCLHQTTSANATMVKEGAECLLVSRCYQMTHWETVKEGR